MVYRSASWISVLTLPVVATCDGEEDPIKGASYEAAARLGDYRAAIWAGMN